MYSPQRYSRVAWIWPSDLDEGRRAVWELDRPEEKTSCWPVSLYEPDASSQTEFLILHAARGNGNDGGYIALSLSRVPHYDWYARGSMGVPVQSGSRRHPYRYDADWWREEGA